MERAILKSIIRVIKPRNLLHREVFDWRLTNKYEIRGQYHVHVDLIASLKCEQIQKNRGALVKEQSLQG